MNTYYLTKTQFLGLLFILFISFSVIAQVGIGNTSPNTNSLLEVGDGTDTKGIILPRVSLTSTSSFAPLSAHVAGMMVFNTAATGDVVVGQYYNDGAKWILIAGDDWKLTGNSGTTAGTNFIGTTDAQDVVIKANNTERGRVKTTETVINEDSNAYNFRVESNTLTNALFVDGTNDAVGIGTSTPASYGGVAVDRFSVVGQGTTTIVGPNTSWTPVSAFINDGDGVSLFAHNASTTNTGAAFESGVQGPGFGVRSLHLPNSGAGYGVYGSTNSPITAWAGYFNGDLYGTNVYQSSDIRWKKNIKDLNKNSLNKIMLLKPKSYQWKADKFPGMSFKKGETSFGFIAQELKDIFPELVTSKAIPDPTVPVKQNQTANLVEGYFMINYTGLIPVLTQAIQEQQEIIEKQNNRITELENIVKEINRKLNN